MSRRKHELDLKVKDDVSVNVVPMIDIMFLLLLFFMLGADMTQRELAELVLPTAENVKVDKDELKDKDVPQTIVNVQHRQEDGSFKCSVNQQGKVCRLPEHWLYVIRGAEYDKKSVKDQLQAEALETMEPDIDPIAKKILSRRNISIRADRTAPYGDIQRLIEICGEVGIFKVEVVAAKPDLEKI